MCYSYTHSVRYISKACYNNVDYIQKQQLSSIVVTLDSILSLALFVALKMFQLKLVGGMFSTYGGIIPVLNL